MIRALLAALPLAAAVLLVALIMERQSKRRARWAATIRRLDRDHQQQLAEDRDERRGEA